MCQLKQRQSISAQKLWGWPSRSWGSKHVLPGSPFTLKLFVGKTKNNNQHVRHGQVMWWHPTQVDCCLPPACIFSLPSQVDCHDFCLPAVVALLNYCSTFFFPACAWCHFPKATFQKFFFTFLYFSQCQCYNATLWKALFYVFFKLSWCHIPEIGNTVGQSKRELGGLCLVPTKQRQLIGAQKLVGIGIWFWKENRNNNQHVWAKWPHGHTTQVDCWPHLLAHFSTQVDCCGCFVLLLLPSFDCCFHFPSHLHGWDFFPVASLCNTTFWKFLFTVLFFYQGQCYPSPKSLFTVLFLSSWHHFLEMRNPDGQLAQKLGCWAAHGMLFIASTIKLCSGGVQVAVALAHSGCIKWHFCGIEFFWNHKVSGLGWCYLEKCNVHSVLRCCRT